MSRREQLFREPLCEHVRDGQRCNAIAEHVHHRRPIEEGGARRDPANLMSVCVSCHTAIHRAREGRRQMRERQPSRWPELRA
jgi:5-methylcytosine-specific restriction endonuclease McrA